MILVSVGALVAVVTFTPLVPWCALMLSGEWTDSDGDVLVVLAGSFIEAPTPGNLIIGESTYWRAVYAVQAWRSGHWQRIVLCGEGSQEAVRPFLIALGVPEKVIVVENQSQSTREHAENVRSMLSGSSARIVLLTSDYHMYRASRTFAQEGMPVITRPLPDLLKRSHSLTFRWQGFWVISEELAKIGYYRARGWI